MGFETAKRELGMQLFWRMFVLNILAFLAVRYMPLTMTKESTKILLVIVVIALDVLAIVVVYYTFKWGDKRWDEITKKRRKQ